MLDKSISKFRKVLLKSYVETEPFVQEVGHFDVTTEGAILGVSRNFFNLRDTPFLYSKKHSDIS